MSCNSLIWALEVLRAKIFGQLKWTRNVDWFLSQQAKFPAFAGLFSPCRFLFFCFSFLFFSQAKFPAFAGRFSPCRFLVLLYFFSSFFLFFCFSSSSFLTFSILLFFLFFLFLPLLPLDCRVRFQFRHESVRWGFLERHVPCSIRTNWKKKVQTVYDASFRSLASFHLQRG